MSVVPKGKLSLGLPHSTPAVRVMIRRADRTRLPAVGPPPSFRFPASTRIACRIALSLWSAEHRTLPVVTFMLVLPVGSAADFEGYEGLAAITADMMDEGTGNLTAIDVNAAFARIGAHLDTDVSADATVFTVTALAKFARPALSLLADCVVRPRLDVADFDRIRQLRLTRLVQIRDMPSAIADRAIMQVVYGTHPYAHMALGTEESLRQLSDRDRAAISRGAVPSRRMRPSSPPATSTPNDVQADGVRRASVRGPTAALHIPEDAAISPPPPAPCTVW